MKTVQNITWMRYLALGVCSAFFCLLLQSCSKDSRGGTGQFYFVNETDHSVSVNFRNESLLNVKARETAYIEQVQPIDKRSKKIVAEDFVNPLTFNDLTVKFGNKCLLSTATSKNSIINLSSYQSEKLDHGKFKFTYRFTTEDYKRAVDCQ